VKRREKSGGPTSDSNTSQVMLSMNWEALLPNNTCVSMRKNVPSARLTRGICATGTALESPMAEGRRATCQPLVLSAHCLAQCTHPPFLHAKSRKQPAGSVKVCLRPASCNSHTALQPGHTPMQQHSLTQIDVFLSDLRSAQKHITQIDVFSLAYALYKKEYHNR
jgi:hypothetical protein